jgi:deoxyribonuclease-4
MRIGAHFSKSGGYDSFVDTAVEAGANTAQVFTASPRTWQHPSVEDSEVEKYRETLQDVDLDPVFVHAGYLINLATPKDEMRQKSIELLKAELEAASALNLHGVVFHPGSPLGEGVAFGRDRLVSALQEVADVATDTYILVENMAGAGNTLGASFDTWKHVLDRVDRDTLGFCFDTCHAHAAGHDLSTEEGVDDVVETVEKAVGWENVPVIHLNDSKHAAGSNKDEHEHLGQGAIGENGVISVLTHEKTREKPFICETPKESERGHAENIAAARHLAAP